MRITQFVGTCIVICMGRILKKVNFNTKPLEKEKKKYDGFSRDT